MEVMETNKLSQTVSGTCTDRLQISENREHSRNTLRSAAGAALLGTFQDGPVKIMLHTEMQGNNCESSKLLSKLWDKEVGVAVEPADEATTLMVFKEKQMKVSKSSEDSLNSHSLQCEFCTQEDWNSLDGDHGKQDLDRTSECNGHLPGSHRKTTTEENNVPCSQIQQSQQCPQDTFTIYGGNSSESSQESSNCVGSNVSVPRLSQFKNMSNFVGLTAAWQHAKVEGDSMEANTVSSAKVNNPSVHTEFNFFLWDNKSVAVV